MQNKAIVNTFMKGQEDWSKESAIIYSQCKKFLSTQDQTPHNDSQILN